MNGTAIAPHVRPLKVGFVLLIHINLKENIYRLTGYYIQFTS
jgi:hypothetical protein